ncbi:MAG: zinc-ribbon domain-containing protein [Candidatus Aminicenantes bacterium]|nr:zinc-ribbon domain-containing protein [Candidatus Aminicenantes bacterium]
MFCKSCGYEIEDDSKYCRKCGNKVNEDISTGSSVVRSQVDKKIIMVVAIAAALIIAAIAFYFLTSIEESPDSKVNNSSFYEKIV